MKKTIGFIGLGNMGTGMARSLIGRGYQLRIYNRSVARAEAFVRDTGAILCTSAASAAHESTAVITMLSNDEAVREVTLGQGGILEGLASGGIHLSASTISPSASRELAAHHSAKGSHYLAAPVFGRPPAAAAAKLHILLSGSSVVERQAVCPVLDAMSQSVWDFGDDPGAANVAKVCGNFMAFAATEAMGEAFTLAEKQGLSRQAVFEMLTSTLFDTPAYKAYGAMVAAEKYEPVGFALPLGLKDVRLFGDLGRQSHTPLPLADLLDQRMAAAVAKGRGHLDAAVFAQEVSEAAGLERTGK